MPAAVSEREVDSSERVRVTFALEAPADRPAAFIGLAVNDITEVVGRLLDAHEEYEGITFKLQDFGYGI